MTQTVRSELLRMLGMFAETDPRSIEYTQLMRNFEILSSQMDMYGEVEELLSEEAESRVTKVDNVIEFPVKACTDAGTDADADERETGADIVGSCPPSESAPAEDRETKPQETPVSGEHPEYKMEDVRAALVAARRRKGINVTALLQEFGVENFSAFPAGRYWELMQRLEGEG